MPAVPPDPPSPHADTPARPAGKPAAASPAFNPAWPGGDTFSVPDNRAPASAQHAPPPPPSPPQAAPTRPPNSELQRKAELEFAMLAAPGDAALRASYFTLLMQLAVTHTGLMWVHLPDLGVPLVVRAGTPDIAVLAQVFRDGLYAAAFRATPEHILVIGAHAGYLAVDLARRHPRARLLCVEPLPENFRLLGMNTAPWPRIRTLQAAMWHNSTKLAPAGRFQGDWSVRISDEAWDEDRTIQALSLPDVLARVGWARVEMIVCDASGAEREIFANNLAPWLIDIDILMVRLHEQLSPGATANVERSFPPALYERHKLSDMMLYVRRQPRMAKPPGPAEHTLLRNAPGLTPFALADVPRAGYGFFVFDGVNCQLHPNPPGAPPARAIFQVAAGAYTRFVSDLVHDGSSGAAGIVLKVSVQSEDGQELATAQAQLQSRKRQRLSVPLPRDPMGQPVTRKLIVVLQAELAPGAPNNQMAWGRWLEPRLL